MRRLRRARAALSRPGPLPLGRDHSARRGADLLGKVLATLPSLRLADRLLVLRGPDLRGALSEIEIWSEVLRLAAAGETVRLFDRLSRTEFMTRLVPSGRLDPGLPKRAARFAAARLDEAFDDLSAVLLGMALACGALACGSESLGPLRLAFRAAPEQGRPRRRTDLGSFGGPAGPLSLLWTSPKRPPERLEARLAHGVLSVGGRLFPLAGSPLRQACNGRDQRGRAASPARPASNIDLVRRRRLAGTPIVMDRPEVEPRFARALRLVLLAWPDAHSLILKHTAAIVPVDDPGVVSYSLAARPGISFINVRGKSRIDLADDLLHETAHHLLHDIEEVRPLHRRGPDTEEVQAFHSPWRRAQRPLHGLLHGTFTFLFRAELFGRLLLAARRRPHLMRPLLGPGGEAFLRRERRRELSMIGAALKDLDEASRAGLLRPAGKSLVRSLRAWRRRLARRLGDVR